MKHDTKVVVFDAKDATSVSGAKLNQHRLSATERGLKYRAKNYGTH